MSRHESIQSVLFDKDLWTIGEARRWLFAHDFLADGKVDTTAHFHRFRQRNPGNNRFFTRKLENYPGVELVIIIPSKRRI